MEMAKPSDYPGFRKLLEEWNQKLFDSGFQDAECVRRGERDLKRPGGERRYEKLDPLVREAKADFFRKVGEKVHETDFKSEQDRKIMTLYAQGLTQKGILKELGIKGHKCRAYLRINKWLKEWGLK